MTHSLKRAASMTARTLTLSTIIAVLFAAAPSGRALAQTGQAILTDALAGNTYDVIVSIKQTGSTAWKLGMASFAFTYDPLAIQFESELEEGNWDNNRFPASYGDQFPAHYPVTGAHSVEVDFTGANGSGVFLSLLSTVVGKLRFTVLDAGRSPFVRWAAGATAVFDDQGIDRTSAMTFDLATPVQDGQAQLPTTFGLDQNYPNPFNPSTSIRFALPRASEVRLQVFDLTGRNVATLADGMHAAGYHTVTFDGEALSSGFYIYRLYAGGAVLTNKMLLVK